MKPLRPLWQSFRNKLYRIVWKAPADKSMVAYCENPKYKKPVIRISPELRGIDKLRTVVDESIHACIYEIDNDIVADMSRDMAVFLWACGLRWKDEMITQAMEDRP